MSKPTVRIQVVNKMMLGKHLASFVRIKGLNGEKMLVSETYASKSGAARAARKLQSVIPGSVIESVTK